MVQLKAYALATLNLIAALPLSQAAYFSEGWTPGQAVPTVATGSLYDPAAQTTATAAAPTVAPARQAQGFFYIEKYLTAGPLASALSAVGVNITTRVKDAVERAEAEERGTWDPRIPLITDENYESIIVNEQMSEDEAEDRVWFLAITAGPQDSLSVILDKHFDGAYNLSVNAQDIPHVRFGRVDYLAVTALTTKWVVWKAPQLVVVKDRGQTLRFFKPNQVRNIGPESLHKLLLLEHWKNIQPWTGSWAPGGSRAHILEKYAEISKRIYNTLVHIPKWLLLMITSALASFLVSAMHRWEAASQKKNQKKKAETQTSQTPINGEGSTSSPATKGASQNPLKNSPKKRKGKN